MTGFCLLGFGRQAGGEEGGHSRYSFLEITPFAYRINTFLKERANEKRASKFSRSQT